MTPWFIATKRFTPEDGEAWDNYIQWSGLPQLEELVSLDGMMCPTLLEEIRDDYWDHIGQESFMLYYFLDFRFSDERSRGHSEEECFVRISQSGATPLPPPVADFEFIGYDLVDIHDLASALTNCGGFPGVFANSESSRFGLLTDFERAAEVQQWLRSLHPEEHHANCHLWATFRAVGV